MAFFTYSVAKEEAIKAFKRSILGVGLGAIAIMKDKGDILSVGSPGMTVTVSFYDGYCKTSSGGFGKALVNSVNAKLELIEGFAKTDRIPVAPYQSLYNSSNVTNESVVSEEKVVDGSVPISSYNASFAESPKTYFKSNGSIIILSSVNLLILTFCMVFDMVFNRSVPVPVFYFVLFVLWIIFLNLFVILNSKVFSLIYSICALMSLVIGWFFYFLSSPSSPTIFICPFLIWLAILIISIIKLIKERIN